VLSSGLLRFAESSSAGCSERTSRTFKSTTTDTCYGLPAVAGRTNRASMYAAPPQLTKEQS
jgi:hypothetical protein